jgi:release factor glutamine methyltransferase
MKDKNLIKKHQEAFLFKAKARTEPISISIQGIKAAVNPGVFPPATDTKLLISNIDVSEEDRIIDITTGSGTVAIIAGLQGASGYAVDINPKAVENARQNIEHYNVDIKVIESNLFSDVPEEKFNFIFANGPFFEGKIKDPMDYACYGARLFVENLLKQVSQRLKPKGKLLIVMSAWAELDHLEAEAKKNGLSFEITNRRKSDDGEREYLLYEISLKI